MDSDCPGAKEQCLFGANTGFRANTPPSSDVPRALEDGDTRLGRVYDLQQSCFFFDPAPLGGVIVLKKYKVWEFY